MSKYVLGTRGHDYGKGKVKDVFSRIQEDGWSCTQLAFKKLVEGVKSYEDVTPELVKEVEAAMKTVPMDVAVLGTYVELGAVDDSKRQSAVADFISQIPVCKALNIPCMGSETTSLSSQPAGTTHGDAMKALLKSLEAIMPVAEEHGVIVALEPVFAHTMNSVEVTREILDSMKSPNLKIIFDMANLMGPEWVEKQDVLYGRAMESWGDQIMAVHFKGVCYDENGRRSCLLEDSIVDYAAAFDAMKGLPQEVIPVLREEAVPMIAKKDQAFMRRFMER